MQSLCNQKLTFLPGKHQVTRWLPGDNMPTTEVSNHIWQDVLKVWIAADFLVVISLICLLLQAINCSDSNITQIRRLNGWPALNTCLAQHYRHVSVSAKTQRLALITILIESPFSLPFGLYSVGGCFPNSASCWLRGWNPTDRQDNSVMQEDIFA